MKIDRASFMKEMDEKYLEAKNNLISSIAYFNMASLSTPIPNANPV